MKQLHYLTVIFLALFTSGVLSLENSRVFGRLPLISDMQISPDGNRIAYLQDIGGRYHLLSKSLIDPNEKPKVYTLKDKSRIRSLTWGNNNNIIFWMSVPYYSPADYVTFTLWRVGIFNANSGNVEMPFINTKFNYNVGSPALVNKLANDTEHVIFSNYYTTINGKTINALYKVNLESGSRDKIFSNPNSGSWLTGQDGNVYAYEEFEPKYDDRVWKYRNNAESDFSVLLILKDKELVPFKRDVIGISDDRSLIYFYELNKKTMRVLTQAEINGVQVVNKKIIRDFNKFDINDSINDSISGLYAGVKYVREYSESSFDNKLLAQVIADLKATFPDAEINLTSYSRDFNRFIAKVSGSNYPEQYFFYDKNAGNLSLLGEGFPGASNQKLRQVRNYQYATSDGLDIDSYLTLPLANSSKPPLIVLPHGGPESRIDASFSWERQFFATHGFAVFEPNFRGSSGYGSKFAKAGYGEWGEKMQRDVDEGVAQLIKEGKVDADKICIIGSSYGGYVAQFAATTKHELYKCAVSYGGISDLKDIFYHDESQKQSIAYWEKSIANRRERKFLNEHSPLFLISKLTSPILLLHGENDTIVPSLQSSDMFRRLKKANIMGSRYIKLENEDHWFSNGESRHIYLQESLQFVKEQLHLAK
ncbi:MAG: prolyl oligopeptidase family serine peptidase [Kangiellaceae bacterium]|nr:prolyl oligopeptidase family serine peptidase [Kangiellaceae bacterium]